MKQPATAEPGDLREALAFDAVHDLDQLVAHDSNAAVTLSTSQVKGQSAARTSRTGPPLASAPPSRRLRCGWVRPYSMRGAKVMRIATRPVTPRTCRASVWGGCRSRSRVQSIPWKRAAQPEEIAKLALFLASPDADYVTGASYVMDGGLMRNLGQGA